MAAVSESNQEILYHPEKKLSPLALTSAQKEAINAITMSIEEVAREVREQYRSDVIETLQNGHPLNRLITDVGGQVKGYIACEDLVEDHEAYVKYFGTTRDTGRSLIREVLPFLRFAKEQGYDKISFHGWNKRLNRILERYGFEPVRKDMFGSEPINFYEKTLSNMPSKQASPEQRKQAYEQKYLDHIQGQQEKVMAALAGKPEKLQALDEVFRTLSQRLSAHASQQADQKDGFLFTQKEQAILKLKIARYLEKQNEPLDANTLFDAIIESPRFIQTDKGSLHRLLEVHEIKTLEKIAELRKQRTESDGPYETLANSASGEYRLVRLLNMAHLQEESQFMRHCVGTSDSYINKIKRGEVEILSIRSTKNGRPILTLEYNLRTNVIEQMKKAGDKYLSKADAYFQDVIELLAELRGTNMDNGKLRNFKHISDSELRHFPVKPHHVLTPEGEVHFRNFNPNSDTFILRVGEMKITDRMSKEDITKIVRILTGKDYAPAEIARGSREISAATRVYIATGPMSAEVMRTLPETVEHLYPVDSQQEVISEVGMIGGADKRELQRRLAAQQGRGLDTWNDAKHMMEDKRFTTQRNPEQIYNCILRVRDLGFRGEMPTTTQLFERVQELGFELNPAERGPHAALEKVNNPPDRWIRYLMEPLPDASGGPRVFDLNPHGDELVLDGDWAGPERPWDLDK